MVKIENFEKKENNFELGCISTVILDNGEMHLINRELDLSYNVGKVEKVNGVSNPKNGFRIPYNNAVYEQIASVVRENEGFFLAMQGASVDLPDTSYKYNAVSVKPPHRVVFSDLDKEERQKIKHAFNATSKHYESQVLKEIIDTGIADNNQKYD